MRPRGFLPTLVLTLAIAGGVASGGCLRTTPKPIATSNCRDACASMACPSGMVCTLGDSCAPRCQPLAMSRH